MGLLIFGNCRNFFFNKKLFAQGSCEHGMKTLIKDRMESMQDIKHSSANTLAKQEVDSELYCAESSGHSLSVTEIQTFANEIQAFADEV